MKKVFMTGLVAVMMVGAAQAATVYEKDGTKVDIKGDVQIQLRQKVGVDKDPYVDYDDLTVGFYAKHKNDAGVTTFSHLKMDWKKQAAGEAKGAVDEASVGLSYGPVKAHIGRIDWGSDSFYVDEAIEIAHELIATPDVAGHETLQVITDLDMAELILSADMEVNEGDDASGLTLANSGVMEAYLVTNPDKFAGLELGVLFQSYQPEEEAEEGEAVEGEDAVYTGSVISPDSVDTIGARIGYKIGNVTLGADYTSNDDLDVMNAVIKAKIVSSTSVAAGYALESPDEGDEVGTWYANVQHKFNKYSKVFAEIGDNDAENTDLGFVAGMQVKF